MKIYLLRVEELNEAADSLQAKCLRKIDEHRLEKIKKCKPGKTRNLAIGAGLLLQLAYAEKISECTEGNDNHRSKVECLTVQEVLELLEKSPTVTSIPYCHVANGKPDFAEGEKHFNLSHSGDYVCLAVAEFEMGIDLQFMRQVNNYRVVDRFFSAKEKQLLATLSDVEKQKEFYRIWVKKEAYAKLTGEGIGKEVGVDTLEKNLDYIFEELKAPADYCMAVCYRRRTNEGQ